MKSPSRENAKLVLVATFCLVIGSLTPAVAGAARQAIAPNADKVDGKHAVGAGASIQQRKGKLVATSDQTGRLPDNIIKQAPDAKKLEGKALKYVRTHWLTVNPDGTILGGTQAAETLTVSHPATGTYCVSRGDTIAASVTGNVQSQLNGFEDVTLVISSIVNTSACPGDMRIYVAKDGVLVDYPFTLLFSLTKPVPTRRH